MTTPTTTAPPPLTATPQGSGDRRTTPATAREKFVPGSLRRAHIEQVVLAAFIALPFAALLAAVPVAWGWGLGWHDIVIAIVAYAITAHGITAGYHRYLTHRSFKAVRALRVALAVAGSLAIQGPPIRWVADHRRHHKYSDSEGDPHSPWRYGENVRALTKGLWHAHVGWMFDVEQTNQGKFAPDLVKDRDISRVNRGFPWLVAASLLVPALIGGLWGWSWQGAVTAFFWAGLVRVSLLHHVTWSINSICHTWGSKPFASRDRSANVWWLAALSMGESWHNLHHADPTCARHGVERGQIDSTARLIRVFEAFGWVSSVRWPDPRRLAGKRLAAAPAREHPATSESDEQSTDQPAEQPTEIAA
jgi:stearoyl-CoA desaturase (delta-9 desaturase)